MIQFICYISIVLHETMFDKANFLLKRGHNFAFSGEYISNIVS